MQCKLTVRAAEMAAICLASDEAAKTAEAVTPGAAIGRVAGSGLATMAMEELLLSASSKEDAKLGDGRSAARWPLLVVKCLRPLRHRRGLVPLGWRRLRPDLVPLLPEFRMDSSCVTIHDSSSAAAVNASASSTSSVNPLITSAIIRKGKQFNCKTLN